MIPKIIHYCWFGRGEKPKLAKKCIKSWKKYCPDYQIIEWNEDNCDIASAPLFVRQAIEAKKWAFASDYIRLKVIYEYGGIYLDTDVELIKSLNEVLNNKTYFGFEARDQMRIATGLGFGSEKKSPILLEIMKIYETGTFFLPGKLDLTWNTIKETEVLIKHGLLPDGKEQILDQYIHIYPPEYFNPGIVNVHLPVHKTEHTISVHWYASSWWTDEQKLDLKKKRNKKIIRYILHNVIIPKRLIIKLLGQNRFNDLKKWIKSLP